MPSGGALLMASGGLIGSYLLGSVPFGFLAGKLRGIDVTSLRIAKDNEGMAVFAEVLAASGIIGVIPFIVYIWRITVAPLKLAAKTRDVNLKNLLLGLGYALIIELMILQFNQNILRLYLWLHISILSATYALALRLGREGPGACPDGRQPMIDCPERIDAP
jgi:glycerol-3-phosphate acyltransferase PlsY